MTAGFAVVPGLDWLWPILAQLPVSEYVRTATWAYPALETLHVMGLGLAFGGIVLFDLRVLGLGRQLSVRALGAFVLPFVWTGFALNAVSGVLLFMSDATEFAGNPALWVKLGLIGAAGLNALFFQVRYRRHIAALRAEQDANLPTLLRASAAASLAIWLGVITAGRMIAYV